MDPIGYDGAPAPVVYLHDDVIGSVTTTNTTATGAPTRLRYDPFGARISLTNPTIADTATPPTTLAFTEHEIDLETGLYNMKGRMFDPKIGRIPERVVENVPISVVRMATVRRTNEWIGAHAISGGLSSAIQGKSAKEIATNAAVNGIVSGINPAGPVSNSIVRGAINSVVANTANQLAQLAAGGKVDLIGVTAAGAGRALVGMAMAGFSPNSIVEAIATGIATGYASGMAGGSSKAAQSGF